MRIRGYDDSRFAPAGTAPTCSLCGEEISDPDDVRMSPLGKPFCAHHLPVGVGGYSSRNHRLKLGKAVGLTFSIELETSGSGRHPIAIDLLSEGFLPSSDSSLSGPSPVEWKSPIYSFETYRSQPVAELMRQLEKHQAELFNDSCGTHIHVGVPSRLALVIKENWAALFSKLSRHVATHPDESALIWGRRPSPNHGSGGGHYAQVCSPSGIDYFTMDASSGGRPSRYCWINVGGHGPETQSGSWPALTLDMKAGTKSLRINDTVEFRLAKFKTVNQYARLVRFCTTTIGMILFSLAKVPLSSDALFGIEEQTSHPIASIGDKVLNKYMEELVAYV